MASCSATMDFSASSSADSSLRCSASLAILTWGARATYVSATWPHSHKGLEAFNKVQIQKYREFHIPICSVISLRRYGSGMEGKSTKYKKVNSYRIRYIVSRI
jgi:hypothetical protein